MYHLASRIQDNIKKYKLIFSQINSADELQTPSSKTGGPPFSWCSASGLWQVGITTAVQHDTKIPNF